MPSTQHHLIRRQFLHVEMNGSESEALALQRSLPDLYQSAVVPALASLLERMVPAHEHWLIDRLEVDAGRFTLENLERGLGEAVAQAIARQLREQAVPATGLGTSPAGPVQRKSQAQAVHEAFLHFLDTGTLSWWFRLPPGQTLEQAVRASWPSAVSGPRHFAPSLLGAMGSPRVQERLAQQFPANFLQALLAGLSSESAQAMQQILARLEGCGLDPALLRRLSVMLWRRAFAAAAIGRHAGAAALVAQAWQALPDAERQDPLLLARITQHWPEALQPACPAHSLGTGASPDAPVVTGLAQAGPTEVLPPGAHAYPQAGTPPREDRAAPDPMTASQATDLREGLYIGCAGLVLLHPFLVRFFEGVGLVADDRLQQPDRALCLLHFLATGERQAPEYELLLPKLLCGVPLEAPAESEIALTAQEEAESAALLGAVIGHWEALGDTSIAGLRETFVIRAGKLSRRDDGDYRLQVEPRSFDVLMDRLPWGLAAIKLPWMENILWVEWTH